MRQVVRVNQGSQPTFGGVRVGVMRAGVHEGVGKVQLLVRSGSTSEQLVASQADVLDLPGSGTLTIGAVEATPGSTAGTVTLTFDDEGAADADAT